MTSISEDSSTKELILNFADGTTAVADAVIACDGIKSVARQKYVLSDFGNEISQPVFTNDVAYRGMFTRARFLEIVGNSIDAGKGTLYCGPQSYVVMYPVEKGTLMNVVAIKHISPGTADSQHNTKTWTQSVSTENVLSDFDHWGTPIRALLEQIQNPQRWALYDHMPAPTFIKGRVALMGDSAHATTPHQGQGAGMAFEDSFVLSNILGQVLSEPLSRSENEKAELNSRIETCFQAYDQVRRPRTIEVTRTSREMGSIIGYREDGIGRDLTKLKANLDQRMNWIWDVDLQGEVNRGVEIVREVYLSK